MKDGIRSMAGAGLMNFMREKMRMILSPAGRDYGRATAGSAKPKITQPRHLARKASRAKSEPANPRHVHRPIRRFRYGKRVLMARLPYRDCRKDRRVRLQAKRNRAKRLRRKAA